MFGLLEASDGLLDDAARFVGGGRIGVVVGGVVIILGPGSGRALAVEQRVAGSEFSVPGRHLSHSNGYCSRPMFREVEQSFRVANFRPLRGWCRFW